MNGLRLLKVAGALPSTATATTRTSQTTRNFNTSTKKVKHFQPETPNYPKLLANLRQIKKTNKELKLTLAEKILYSHLTYDDDRSSVTNIVRGDTYLRLSPDRVAMQDASAQMALLQFMLAGLKQTKVPASIHCDHLIAAHKGPKEDLKTAGVENKEVFDFLESAAKKYGIDFWHPGSGIIHQIVLENYAMPGSLLLGTDSHTPNAGGLGQLAIGVGGADAVDAMVGVPWELKAPKVLGVRLDGKLNGWTSPKDVVLHILGKLSVKGGTGYIIEYFGPGVEKLSCTGMATICNMGAEMGATTSVFPFNPSMHRYLNATGRSEVADIAVSNKHELFIPDDGCHYDEILEIDLSMLEPRVNGPFTPDRSFTISEFKSVVEREMWPTELSAALIGSCTNSSYEDMTKATSVAQQAIDNGYGIEHNIPTALLVTPGSTQIQHTIHRDGLEKTLQKVGAMVLANACGPCIGQWKRQDIKKTNKPESNNKNKNTNIIMSSYNRNFAGRNDGNVLTMNFLASPELVMAMAISGKTTFNPLTDTLTNPSTGKPFKLSPPNREELPPNGFSELTKDIVTIANRSSSDTTTHVIVDPQSTRLQLLNSNGAWNEKDFTNMPILIKVRGKCTTDHISAAGVWLKYKGHLDNISENTLIGACSDETGEVNRVYNIFAKKVMSIPDSAREYQRQGIDWMVIGDENYGEGSAREHAAMQVRHLGGRVVVCRSFARIHETNLKKSGVLPLTLVNPADYNRIPPRATVSTVGLQKALQNKTNVILRVTGTDAMGNVFSSPMDIACSHTMNDTQIAWFRAGSALNLIQQSNSNTDTDPTSVEAQA